MIPTRWPTKCFLLPSAPPPLSTQNLKGSSTHPGRLYWNPFHIALLCPCPAAAQVNSKSPLLPAVLELVVPPGQKKRSQLWWCIKGRWRNRSSCSLCCYYCSSFIVIIASLIIALHLRNVRGAHFCLQLAETEHLKTSLRTFEIASLRKITNLSGIIPLDFLYACRQG